MLTRTNSSSYVHVLACVVASVLSNSATLWTAAHQAPLSMRILQARILEWVAISCSRRSSQPRDQTHVSSSPALAGGFSTTSTTWEALLYAYTSSTGNYHRWNHFCCLSGIDTALADVIKTFHLEETIFSGRKCQFCASIWVYQCMAFHAT